MTGASAPPRTPRVAPSVTYGLVTYRQEAFVQQALRSALAQDYQPLEIVLCDDASPDGTWERACEVAAAYSGPHTLRLHRNERNLGIGNFNRLMELANGDLVVIAHGDDYSRAERVRRIVDIWLRTGASMIVSNWLVVDARGRRLGYGHPPGRRVSLALRDLAARGRAPVTLGAVLAWQRRVFDEFGPLDAERSAVTTDYILPFRAALLDGIAYVDVPLVGVRSHDGQKHSRYLGDKHDALAAAEGRRANQMMQGLYMLDTLDDAARRRLKPAQTLEEARALVHRFLLGVAHDWRMARNGLYASGRRARWLALEP